jgi:hypothetical protein
MASADPTRPSVGAAVVFVLWSADLWASRKQQEAGGLFVDMHPSLQLEMTICINEGLIKQVGPPGLVVRTPPHRGTSWISFRAGGGGVGLRH